MLPISFRNYLSSNDPNYRVKLAFEQAKQPLQRCYDLISIAERTLQLSKYALRQAATSNLDDIPTDLYQFMYTICPGFYLDGQVPGGRTPERLRREFLDEIEAGFPTANVTAALAVWASFESCMGQFTSYWVSKHLSKISSDLPPKAANIVEALRSEATRGVELGFDGYTPKLVRVLMNNSARPSFVFKLEYTLLKLGLKELEIGDSTLLDLVELQAVRNIYMHNDGLVDQEFRQRCSDLPSVAEGLDEMFFVSPTRMLRYLASSRQYLNSIRQRVLATVPEVVNYR